MESSAATTIGLGVTAIVVVISFFLYRQMGLGVSASVRSDDNTKEKKGKDEAAPTNSYPAGKLSIYFGSQTGTSEGFARTLMEEGKKAGFDTKTVDLEDFDVDVLTNETEKAIFLMATYGEGEPTDNAITFSKWVKNTDGDVAADALAKVNFSVFGLGNKQYEHYNLMGKTTNKSIEALGGKRMFDYGEGDDDASLEEDFEAWKSLLWPALVAAFHPDAKGGSVKILDQSDVSEKVTLEYDIVKCAREERKVHDVRIHDSSNGAQVNSSTRYFFTSPRAKLVAIRELRNSSKKDAGCTKHCELDLAAVGLKYTTADNLALLPENSAEVVKALASAMGYDLGMTFNKVPKPDNKGFKAYFPTPCSVEDLLTLYLDIQGSVKQALLKHLVPYVQDSEELKWLTGVLHKDRRHELKVLVEDEGLSFASLITTKLRSCKIPLVDLMHILPFIQPRYYTISSSSSCFPDTVHITVSITEYALNSGAAFKGLTSGYLKDLSVGETCRVFVRPSAFRLPASLSTPIVMIGPGTGLAPMRALLQERQFQREKTPKKAGRNILFFGCKYADVDFIYQDELEDYKSSGVLDELHLAFSRDSKKKVYVQDLMADEAIAKDLVSLVRDQGAYVYVCGATAMGSDVMTTFTKILQQHGGSGKAKESLLEPEAIKFLKDLQDSGRYVQELWTA